MVQKEYVFSPGSLPSGKLSFDSLPLGKLSFE